MFDTLMVTMLSGLGACAFVLATVKRTAPITEQEAKVMWTMHRKTTHCKSHKWQPIKRKGNRIIGFKCDCGYKYTQKRPLISGTPKQCIQYSEHPASFPF